MTIKTHRKNFLYGGEPYKMVSISSSRAVLFIVIVSMLLHWGCSKGDSDTQQAIKEIREQCLYRISGPHDKKMRSIAYGLGPAWDYSSHWVETLYEKDFFFLFQKESTFTNKTDDKLKTIVFEKYSCSGVPPHLLLLESTYFSLNKHNDTVKIIKKEVLESDNLTLAPTDKDETMDILYWQIKNEKRKE